MKIDLEDLKKLAEEKFDAAERLLRVLPEDPLDLNRRLAEEILELGGWLLVIIDSIPDELR